MVEKGRSVEPSQSRDANENREGETKKEKRERETKHRSEASVCTKYRIQSHRAYLNSSPFPPISVQ